MNINDLDRLYDGSRCGPKVNLVHEVRDISDESPSGEVVTVAEVKKYLRLTGFEGTTGTELPFTDEDELISETITVAREMIEEDTRLSLYPKTLEALVTNMCGGLEIPRGPVREIISSAYQDESGDLEVETYGLSFPKLKTLGEKMLITYEAGYESVPAALKRAVMIQAAFLYMNRGEEQEQTGLCKAARVITQKFRRGSWLA